ncbi:MAG: 3-hydroxyacyl-CoA dehydrogenase NAD-binding domain-containing protein [Candidatus Berkiellales bacterium]
MDQQNLNNTQHWSCQIDEDNILWIGFNQKDSAVNTLNDATMREFEGIIQNIGKTGAQGAVIYSLKKTGFIVGADINQFKKMQTFDDAHQVIQKGQDIFNQLQQVNIPTVAMIEGLCLGGGLELSLACRYRVAENSLKTRLGLPEVKLGIHPGWGGTVRLPQLVGVISAMELMLTGKTIAAKAAKKMGLVNEAVPARLLKKAAKAIVMGSPEKKSFSVTWQKPLESSLARPLLGKWLTNQLSKKISANHYPAPYQIVENWVEVGSKDPQALQIEGKTASELLVSDTSRNLVRVFFLQEQLKGLAKGINFQPKHVHVVGAGVMGGDIAAWCALRGFKVTLQDQAPKMIGDAVKRAYQMASKQLKEKYLIDAVMDRLIPDPQGIGVSQADVIIEAITEKLAAKQVLFGELEHKAKKDAILATNTSTIPLEEIRTVMNEPKRLIGIHFFNPVAKMPLVEVVHAKDTLPVVMENTLSFVRKIDKLPLPVKSSPGFLVNRILFPYMLEAMILLEEGIPAVLIDKAAKEYGMPMGPVELADTVGLDVCLASLEKLIHDSKNIPSKLKEYVNRGELGRKSGKGFYQYEKGKLIKPKIANNTPAPQDIIDRLTLRLFNEAVACLREGIVQNSDLIDAGCIFGFGFPPFRGGPLTAIHFQSKEKVLNLLNEFTERYGDRFVADKGWEVRMSDKEFK